MDETKEINNKMKVINFASYKGGVGRTYLTAQVALILAALGKKVVILDFDIDAPGIPGAFKIKDYDKDAKTQLGYYSKIEEGFFELADEYMNLDIANPEHENLVKFFIEKMDKNLFEIDIREFKSTQNRYGHADNEGYIKILPSGKLSDAYWEKLDDIRWMQFINSSRSYNSLRGFIENALVPTLAEHGVARQDGGRQNVDYFLIDSRAGVNNYGGVARHVADRQVMVLTASTESQIILGEYLLPRLHRKQKKDLEKIVFVISRIPYEFYDESSGVVQKTIDDLENFILSQITDRVKSHAKILKLSSDLETYYDLNIRTFDERYLKGYSGDKNTDVVRLHEDVLKLVAALCPEVVPLKPEDAEEWELKNQAHALWKAIYSCDFRITKENRLYEQKQAKMLNIDDGQRNVAFKVETFLNLLRSIGNKLQSDEFIDALETAGVECGKKFASEWTTTEKISSPKDRIGAWCKFDTRSGFGAMDFKDGIVTITDPFVEGDYSVFLFGYVKGVLGTFGYTQVKDLTDKDSSILKYKVETGQLK